jgi:hypothetical protein
MSGPKGAALCGDVDAQEREIGPTAMAADLRIRLAHLERQRAALPISQRRAISERLKMVHDMLKWCETRAGYRP